MWNNGYDPFYPQGNPYLQQQGAQARAYPQQQVVRVNGRNGATAFQMGPNSSAILLDESGTMVWLVVTDGAGYKTVSPYDINPHQDAPAPDYSDMNARLTRLEEIVNGNSSNSAAAQPGADAAAVSAN